MKLLLTTLNSKYTHTSLAIRDITNWLNTSGIKSSWVEYTINTPIYDITGDLYRQKPDILIFSVYIWNAYETRIIAEQLKKLMPNLIIVFGGPEVSFDSALEMESHDFIDFIVRGEGEQVTEELMAALLVSNTKKSEMKIDTNFAAIKGLTWRNDNQIIVNENQEPISMDQLAFPYPDLQALSNRILYYESSRGCPYNCSYCLSSATKGVRFRSDNLVKKDLAQFIEANVKQVKFIDRTFNANPDRALALWQYLASEDKGHTNFHFEITAELLRDKDIEFLKTVRAGLFQFEVGIQTTMKEAREAVNRRLSFNQIRMPVQALLSAENLHIHLDLIAGLPYEGYDRFLTSFDEVYALNPQVLQLGFLKLIKGSGIRSQEMQHGYIYENGQPYEVLQNKYISFESLLKLKDIEACLEHLHNSKRFKYSLKHMIAAFETPSAFYECFSKWLRAQGYFNEAIKTENWYLLLWKFGQGVLKSEIALEKLKASLMVDFMSALGKQLPEWLIDENGMDIKSEVFEIVKQPEFEVIVESCKGVSPKERVKKIRYIGVSEKSKHAISEILQDKVIKLQTNTSQKSILIVELNEKHPVTELYSIYLFV